ncbi:hypothetical protein EW146_g3926 [Bondarzewia mesenterica]|uniref:PXA domain-containing protein n=1 Tax=Bondarzewia mesenterica TaxID=1095465 RepID=A0A4S4LXX3_9AGAM|nr:hypothetical protein EW146_g3926 [Bondarzewia mesenterica]
MPSSKQYIKPTFQSHTTYAPSLTSSGRSKPPPANTISQPITLTKRLLFPHLPPGAPIPPILASPNAPAALNTELYDFIALALRAFVNPWWTKITRYDKEFLVEITRISTVVLRAIETRVIATDLSPLVYRDLPTIVTQHYRDYRTAAQKLNTSYSLGGSSPLPALFHAQQQHIGVTPEGNLDDVYVRTAVDAVLKACLPPEDWDAESERYIIREVVVKVICGNVVPRITQGWFVNKTILDLLGPADLELVKPIKPPDPKPTTTFSIPSFHTLIVFFLSAVQSISTVALTLIHLYKQTLHTIKLVNHSSRPPSPATSPPISRSLSDAPVPPPLPDESPATVESPAITPPSPSPVPSTNSILGSIPTFTTPSPPPSLHQPARDLARPLTTLAIELLTLRSRFASTVLSTLIEMLISTFTPFLDCLLPYMLYTHALSPDRLITVLITAKRTLFPNGYPAATPPDPTPEEQVALRAGAARRIAQLIPGPIAPIVLGPTPAVRAQTMDALLDPLSSAPCNTHLFVMIFDLVLLTLFPELGVGGGGAAISGSGAGEAEDE